MATLFYIPAMEEDFLSSTPLAHTCQYVSFFIVARLLEMKRYLAVGLLAVFLALKITKYFSRLNVMKKKEIKKWTLMYELE